MREIHLNQVRTAVRDLVISANLDLGKDVEQALEKALAEEVSPTGKDILEKLLLNAAIARDKQIPIC
ncbi:MAG: fumarate hydratase, partial [Deltaproteobacteria bacterium]|nr:fumarate hydratase [Deltaproteobacteria bacterium]